MKVPYYALLYWSDGGIAGLIKVIEQVDSEQVRFEYIRLKSQYTSIAVYLDESMPIKIRSYDKLYPDLSSIIKDLPELFLD